SSVGDFAGEFSYSYPLFQQFSRIASPWGQVFATERVGPTKFGLNGVSDERVAGEAVSGNFFSVLNVGPIVGRVLEPQDDNVLGGNHVAVLSYAFWKRRFNPTHWFSVGEFFMTRRPTRSLALRGPDSPESSQRSP